MLAQKVSFDGVGAALSGLFRSLLVPRFFFTA
jgi:hypothetical protein